MSAIGATALFVHANLGQAPPPARSVDATSEPDRFLLRPGLGQGSAGRAPDNPLVTSRILIEYFDIVLDAPDREPGNYREDPSKEC